MKIKSLNAKGFAHVVAIVLVVVGVAAVGTYALVASKADTTLNQAQITAQYQDCVKKVEFRYHTSVSQRAASQVCLTTYQSQQQTLASTPAKATSITTTAPTSTANVSSLYDSCVTAANRLTGNARTTALRSCQDTATSQKAALPVVVTPSVSTKAVTAKTSATGATPVKAATPTTAASTSAASTAALSASPAKKSSNCNNTWGLPTYYTGGLDASGQAIIVTCSTPTTLDPCGAIGATPVPCTPANPHPSSTTCNYGGVYPDCIRILNNTEYKCPANFAGSTLCDLSTAEPVKPSTPVPAGCYSTLDEGQTFITCPESAPPAKQVKNATTTDFDITQQFNNCNAAASVGPSTKFAAAVQACTKTYTAQEAALNTTGTPAPAPKTATKSSSNPVVKAVKAVVTAPVKAVKKLFHW